MLQHHDEARLRSSLVHSVGQTVVQRIEVLAEVGRKRVLRCNQVQHILLALGLGQVGIQEVMTQRVSSMLQILHAVSPNGLHDIRSYITKWHVHLRFSFNKEVQQSKNLQSPPTISLKLA